MLIFFTNCFESNKQEKRNCAFTHHTMQRKKSQVYSAREIPVVIFTVHKQNKQNFKTDTSTFNRHYIINTLQIIKETKKVTNCSMVTIILFPGN